MPTGDADRFDDIEILPDRSHDDSDVGWGHGHTKRSRPDADDQWLLEERPPHWE